ncbi:Endonuclease/exonuclease/phosphatase [Lipomyces chichibuensis]|uniref:Endonuclease/exonuclease/phosphatase n=1 Tax=Lipomyces chichibuensis TaxID=1546026 RepID=UPI00334303F0
MCTETDDLKLLLFAFNCGQIPHASTVIRNAILSTIVRDQPTTQPQTSQSHLDFPDFIFLSLQELAPIYDCFLWRNEDEFLTPFIDAVTHLTGINEGVFEHVATCSAGLTFAVLFRHVPSSLSIGDVRTSVVTLGYFETGLKGAASIRANVSSGTLSTEITFVAAHLTANEGYREIRDHNFQDIARKFAYFTNDSVNFSKEDATDRDFFYKDGSQVFILGDLNYRVALPPPTTPLLQAAGIAVPGAPSAAADQSKLAGNYLRTPKWVAPQHSFVEDWMDYDELTISRKHAGTAFFGFDEADVTFPPTYKFDSNREYAPGRVPSWCDRVLYFDMFEGGSGIKVEKYASLPELDGSDHIPVYAITTVPFKRPGSLSEQLVANLLKHNIAASTAAPAYQITSRGVSLDRQVAPTAIRARQIKLQNRHIAARTGRIKAMEKLIGGLVYLVLTPAGNGILLAAVLGLVSAYMLLRTYPPGIDPYRTGLEYEGRPTTTASDKQMLNSD